MAGVKGRSGGARPNSGPKPKRRTRSKQYLTDDPDEFLKAVMRDPRADFKDRMSAALALKKSGVVGGTLPQLGKRAQQQHSANGMAKDDLAPMAPPTRPRLRSVK